MNWRRGASICLLLPASCAGAQQDELSYFPNVGVYEASPQQERVDRSFSGLPIETPFAQAKGSLSEIVENDCEKWGECEWRDANGVRHYFFDDLLVVKRVDAADFSGRPIPALGIGAARERKHVLKAARSFLAGTAIECSSEGEADGSVHCGAALRPGWVTIHFDGNGLLTEVQLDGYHFT